MQISQAEYELIRLLRSLSYDSEKTGALCRIASKLTGVLYGDVTAVLQAGKVIYVDRHERERVG